MNLLTDESKLEEVVKLVGIDALSAQDRLKLETAKSIREDFLHQNAFHDVDTFTSFRKQHAMMKLILEFHDTALMAIRQGANILDVISVKVCEKIGRFKYVRESSVDAVYEEVYQAIEHDLNKIFNKEKETYANGI